MIRTTIHVRDGRSGRDVEVSIPPSATVADVCTAVGVDPDRAVHDGRPVDPHAHAADVAWPRGALLTTTDQRDVGTDEVCPGRFEWLTGPHAGLPAPIDPDVNRRPFALIGGRWAVRRGRGPRWSTAAVPPGMTAAVVHPGLAPPTAPAPEPVDLPADGPPPPEPRRPGWAVLCMPLVVGVALGVLVAPTMALFCLLSPVMALATWFDDRCLRRRFDREAADRRSHQRRRLETDLAAARQRAMRHAWARVPVPGDLVRALERGNGRLWQHEPPVEVLVGAGPGTLDVPVRGTSSDPYVFQHVRHARADAVVPLTVPLTPGTIVGVCGPARQDLARAIVLQAAALVGPADLRIATPWGWSGWLPHAQSIGATVLEVVEVPMARLAAPGGSDGIVVALADHPSELPPETSTVVVATQGSVEVTATAGRLSGSPILVDVERAAAVARAAARWVDARASAMAPTALLDLPPAATGTGAVIGCGPDGPVTVDLVGHGPHALIAGTTGSGKSELLRTLVAGLAAAAGPDRLALLLLDFKGGATFDPLRALPQTIGLLTDLDRALTSRTLRVLRAELTRRELLLREFGTDDIDALADGELPRLVVVVDEVAALLDVAAEADAVLTDIAQRGRSLGVHLVLATQRARGVVSDALRANLALRICLRTESADDARDVVGTDEPAWFRKDQPGRAIIGGGLAGYVQVADGGIRRSDEVAVLAVDGVPAAQCPPGAKSDLERLVSTCRDRWGSQAPRIDLPLPLPTALDVDDLADHTHDAAAIGLVDEPDHLRVRPLLWDLRGHLLIHGRDVSAAVEVLQGVALHLADRHPDQIHMYGITAGGLTLRSLADLPHTGGIVDASDRPGLGRLIGRLEAMAVGTTAVLFVAGWDHLERALDDAAGFALRERLQGIVEQGLSRGVVLAATSLRPATIPAGIIAGASVRVVCALADPSDDLLLGRRAGVEPLPGRGYLVGSGSDVQLATSHDPFVAAGRAMDRWGGQGRGPDPLPPTPRPGSAGDLPPARRTSRGVVVALGWSVDDAEPVDLVLRGGEHVVIAGQRGSGRTWTLRSLATRLTEAAEVAVVTRTPQEWDCSTYDPGELPTTPPAPVVLVDDADHVGTGTPLDRWVDDPEVTLVVGATAARLHVTSDLWLTRVRLDRTGLVLAPVSDRDAMVLDLAVPAGTIRQRGYALAAVDGRPCSIVIPGPDDFGVSRQTMAADETVGFARTKSTIRWT